MHWHNSGGTLLVVSAVELMMQGNCAMACAYAAFTGRVEWFQKFLADAETAGFQEMALEMAFGLNSMGTSILTLAKAGAEAAGIDTSTDESLTKLYVQLATGKDADGLGETRAQIVEVVEQQISVVAALAYSNWAGLEECAAALIEAAQAS
jgi:hypothetical protein